jgi:hypothetical protein
MVMVCVAPLTEHFSNRQFIIKLDELMHGGEVAIPVRRRERLCECGCGCGELVTGQRKYVNQDHYTVWLTLVQYPQWREKRTRLSR